jgi:hypothetical protein
MNHDPMHFIRFGRFIGSGVFDYSFDANKDIAFDIGFFGTMIKGNDICKGIVG